jgi:glycosyltransferase involved in cell wall biosynthesis
MTLNKNNPRHFGAAIADMELPLISVVIPCFNSGATIQQTVRSIRAQTWPLVEIIVVDDGSDDPLTVTVLDSLEGIILIRQKNKGLPSARNAGCLAATGTFLIPLDADDWLEPTALEKMVMALDRNQDDSFVFCFIELEGEAQGKLIKNYNFFEQLFLNQLPYCILISKSLWIRVGGYDSSMSRGYEDWELSIRLGAHGCFGISVREPLFHYRVSTRGMLLSKSNAIHGELWSSIQSKHRNLYGFRRLFGTWIEWRKKPSIYPLGLYFFWLLLHKLTPPKLFSRVFGVLRKHSHSNRITRRNRTTAIDFINR